MIFDDKFIHPVSESDTILYKKLCPRDSHYFSNSEAYLNSYLNAITPAFCYNDKETIFFFGRLSKNAAFICCPKGTNIESKISQSIPFLRDKYKFKKIWLFEIPKLFLRRQFIKTGIKKWELIKMERPLLSLKKFENLSIFLKKHKRLRKKWNYFFNFLEKKYQKKIVCLEQLSPENYADARKILTHWYRYIKNNKLFISPEFILKKDLAVISDAILRPWLYEGFIFYCNNIPRGVKVAFRIANSLNLSASVSCTDRVIPGTAAIINLLFSQSMAEKGYEMINLGSSYSQSIAEFKQQFRPDKYDISYEYYLSF